MSSLISALKRVEFSLNNIESLIPKVKFASFSSSFDERIDEFRELILKIDLEKTPRSLAGKTCVYLPHSHSDIVLKATGSEASRKRLQKIRKAQQLVDKLKISCLVIPETMGCGEFLIAKRLPIHQDFHQSMSVYYSEPELFDQVVRESVRLFRECDLPFLICFKAHPFNFPEVKNYIKYDNIPFYIARESDGRRIGKIGLIDLERFTDQPSDQALERLARIFPFHLPIILEEAKDLEMEFDLSSLKAAKQQGELFIELCYINPYNKYATNEHLSSNKTEEIIDPEMLIFPTVEMENQTIQNIKDALKIFINKNFIDHESKEHEKHLEEVSDKIFLAVLEAANQSMEAANINKIKLFNEQLGLAYPFIPMTTCIIKCQENLKGKLIQIWLEFYTKVNTSPFAIGFLQTCALDSMDFILKQLVEENILLQVEKVEFRHRSRGRLHTAFWVHFDVLFSRKGKTESSYVLSLDQAIK